MRRIIGEEKEYEDFLLLLENKSDEAEFSVVCKDPEADEVLEPPPAPAALPAIESLVGVIV